MSRRRSQPIVDNAYVKELLAALQAHQAPGYQEFAEVIGHVTEMERRLADAVEELKTVRQELQEVQSHTLKASLQKTSQALESSVASMRQRLAALKQNIVEGCKNALTEFKAHGASALDGIARFFHIKPALESMRSSMDASIRTDDKAIAKIEAFSAEYHEAGRHLKNMGRALRSKEAVQEAKGVGRLAKTIQAPYRAERACMVAAKKCVEKALDSLTRLEQSAQRKPSVLKTMQENGEKVQPPQAKTASTADRGER